MTYKGFLKIGCIINQGWILVTLAGVMVMRVGNSEREIVTAVVEALESSIMW